MAGAPQHLERLLALRRDWPENLVLLERVSSTHTLGRRLVREYHRELEPPPSTLLVAHEQNAGHGRGERAWFSPPGNGIYATLVLPELPKERLRHLPMEAIVALAEGLNRSLDGACRLKWPNDLLVRGAKISGLLLHALHDEDGGVVVLLSFGVNHGRAPLPGTTSVKEEAPGEVGLSELTWELVELLEGSFSLDAGRDPEEAAAEAAARFAELAVHQPGDQLICRMGAETVEGIFLGFDPHGHLRLLVGDQERRLASGEIVTAEDPP